MTDKQELLPCPFCGGSPTLERSANRGGDPGALTGMAIILCDTARCPCHIGGEWQLEAKAITAWNRRTPDPKLAKVTAERDEALKYAERLAVYLHGQHYADVTQWRPLPDLIGLLTQIDNMIAEDSSILLKSAEPVRVQLSRRKGWRMPPDTVKVSRPGPWGNPFIVSDKIKPGNHIGAEYIAVPTVEEAVACFSEMLSLQGPRPDWMREHIHELRGKNLACWCALDQPCHADVLLRFANLDPPKDTRNAG